MYTSDFRYISSNHKTPFFLAHYSPSPRDNVSARKAVILVPPFAEELNRSKRMYVLCARQLASAGLDVVCFDYVGTGDSYGDWGSFSIPDWQANLAQVYAYIQNLGISDISVISLRFGALVVANSIFAGQLQFNKCVFWDPIEDGEGYVRQLIRLKIAAAMTEDAKSLTTKEVLADIDQCGFVEVGGYHVTAELLDAIKRAKLSNLIEVVIDSTELHWMILKNASQNSGGATWPMSIAEGLRENVTMHTVQDTRFWMQQEVTIAPALLQETLELFANAE